MSDELVMSSADSAAAASAAEAILSVIERRFECVEGSPMAYAEFTIALDGTAPTPGKRWERARIIYAVVSYGYLSDFSVAPGRGLGSLSLSTLVEVFPDFIEQALEHHNETFGNAGLEHNQDGGVTLVLEPGHERLVWRRKPTVELRNGRWYCSCRLGFMPKAGVLLPMEE